MNRINNVNVQCIMLNVMLVEKFNYKYLLNVYLFVLKMVSSYI